jgi:PAS domain S-box-containing protein
MESVSSGGKDSARDASVTRVDAERTQPARLADPARVAALREAALLDTAPEESFDRLTRLAANLLGVPVSLVTLIEHHRQFFKSAVGLPEAVAAVRETPLSYSLCQHVAASGERLVIDDARDHPLGRDNLAVRELGVAAYAGFPLVTRSGAALGSFCAIDMQPRHWSERDLHVLEDLAASVMTEIELRTAVAESERRATDAERERKERLAVMDSASEGIYTVDQAGLCTFVNGAACAALGYQSHELLGREMHALLHHSRPDGTPYPKEECPLYQAFRDGRPVRLPNELMWRHDGSRIAVECASSPVLIDGQITGAVVTFGDITARVREEAARRFLDAASSALASSLDYETTLQRTARLALPTLGDACVVDMVREDGSFESVTAHIDPSRDGLLRELRRRVPANFGSNREEVMATLRTGEPRLVPEITSAMRRATARDDEHFEMLETLGLDSSLHVPLTARGRTFGVLTCAATERRLGPDDLALAGELAQRAAVAIDNAKLYHEARQATRARDDVLGIVSHDLRNPIHTIFMSASFLLELLPADGADEEKLQVRIIKRSAERANRLIRDLLDVSRIERGELAVERRPRPVDALIADVMETSAPLAAERTITIDACIAEPGLIIEADQERIAQVFSNLIGNAIKFTPSGGRILVRVDRVGDDVRFGVSDTGSGIRPEHLPHLFDRYWQAQRTDKRGVGLGLSIAKGIVEAHGGRIWVESEPGKGSTFYFTIPRQKETRDTVRVAVADAAPVETR